jgi:hypothetical protein
MVGKVKVRPTHIVRHAGEQATMCGVRIKATAACPYLAAAPSRPISRAGTWPCVELPGRRDQCYRRSPVKGSERVQWGPAPRPVVPRRQQTGARRESHRW